MNTATTPLRILLLEDDLAVAASLVRSFALRGFQYVAATTVAEASSAYAPGAFNVIIADYQLPDGTGLDFLALVEPSDPAYVVLFSGLDRSREIAASGLRVDRQISKGDPFALWDAIEAVTA